MVRLPRPLLAASLLPALAAPSGALARELPEGWSILGFQAATSTDEVVLTTRAGECATGCTWPEAVRAGLARHPNAWLWDGESSAYLTPEVDGLEIPAMQGAWLFLTEPADVAIGAPASRRRDAAEAGDGTLELAGRDFELDWSDEFDTLSIEHWGSDRGARWFASTPWGGDFGDAAFREDAASIEDGHLAIEANRKREPGVWTSGLLSLRHPSGRGRTWETGYFEARMDLPEGPGTWPAFWLGSTRNAEGYSAEVDVLEHYGHAPHEYHAVAHTWRPGHEDDHPWSAQTIVQARAIAERGWTTLGVEITSTELVYYHDRREVWRIARPAEWAGLEFYPIVNLALGSGWPIDRTPDPSVLLVDYVRVYRPR